MSKRSLMLSTAAVALLTGMALADTSITDSQSGAYTTGTKLSSNTGTEKAGNVTVKSGGSISVSAASQGALTIDSNHWALIQGSVLNKDADNASAIHVDLSTNPNLAGATFQNTAGTTIVGSGIYLDTSSSVSVTGSNSGKITLFLDGASCSSSGSCAYTGTSTASGYGAVTLASGSSLSVSGDGGHAIQIGNTSNSYATLNGDLYLGGTVTATAGSSGQTSTGMYGLVSYGTINGNVLLTGSLTAYGHGATGMSIQGGGINKSLTISGTLATSILSTTNYNVNQKVNTTTNAEAGSALQIAASIGQGVEITGPTSYGASAVTGSISVAGTSPAVNISPSLNTTVVPSQPLTIGVYKDDTANPGFSFYNRGSISASYTNYDKATTAMVISSYSSTLPTILTGGLYTSGSISASSLTSGSSGASSSVQAVGLTIGDYVQLGANISGKPVTADQAALEVSGLGSASGGGSISASVTGTRGGLAEALYIGPNASVPSLINTGTISAMVTTTDATLSGAPGTANPVVAYAIVDASGSLTSITNSGTISAVAGYVASSSSTSVGVLDNDKQVAIAIQLAGAQSDSAATTIQNYASSVRAAIITGDINFGSGNNQLLDLVGSSNYQSVVTGNVSFGRSINSIGGDRLHIGENSTLSGKVVTQETVPSLGVQVDVDSHGTLNLLNTTQALNATAVTVKTGGTLNLGVSRQLTTSGVIASQSVKFATDATLTATYQSYVPQTTKQFVLMTAKSGQLSIDQSVIDAFNTATYSGTGQSKTPYLLKSATMCSTQLTPSCRPSASVLPTTQDALVINVATKSATEIGLSANSIARQATTTSNGVATTLFDQANLALGIDDDLGAAFINGIANAKQAAQAYNDMAPNVTGGSRAIAISITDSATGPVAARQRSLRMYGKTQGDMTIWGQEFVQMLKDPGNGAVDPNTGFKSNPGFKDHGFGLALGIDAGSPKYGWYGGAITFYQGDINELARNAHANEQWYLLSLYSVWRGKGFFLDTKLDAGYGNIDGKRNIVLAIPNSSGSAVGYYTRQATNKHAGALVSGSVATGVMYAYGAATFMPQFNVDGLLMREEGYTEKNPGTTTTGDGFDLSVQQYYAKSLRVFMGLDVRYDLNVFDIYLQPEGRAGYRYDFLNDPAKVKAAFAYSNVTANAVTAGDTFTLRGPEPSRGSFVLGGSLSTSTDSWSVGLNFDFVKGSNGAFQQVGTLHILGRI